MEHKLVKLSTNSYTEDTHFLVSADKYEEIASHNWYADLSETGRIRIARRATKEERDAGSPSKIKVHRQVLGIHLKKANKYEEVDHLDRNIFNNTNENLKLKSTHENARNRYNNTGIGEGLWGASFNKNSKLKPWMAQIYIKNKKYYPKPTHYKTEMEAHLAAVNLYREMTGRDPMITLPETKIYD